MSPDLLAVASQHHGLFTRAQALASGYSDREISRLLRREWTRIRHGVYMTTESFTIANVDPVRRQVMRVASVLLRRGSRNLVASHDSAAILHGLETLGRRQNTVTLTDSVARTGERLYDGALIRAAFLPPHHRGEIHGIAVTNAARTVLDRARSAPFLDALITADHALHLKLTDQSELKEVLLACSSWPGINGAHRVLRFADGRAESAAETMGRFRCAEIGLPPPEPNQWIATSDWRYRTDLLWEDLATVAEIDGKSKYVAAKADTLYQEKLREDRLREAGLEVVRFTAVEAFHHPEVFASRLTAAFSRAMHRYGSRGAAAGAVRQLRRSAG